MMKKFSALFLTLTLLLGLSSISFAQTYTTGRVYVEGSSKNYGNGDTLTVEHARVIHIARLAEGKKPLSKGDYWLSCWYPDNLIQKGFVLYGKNGEDGAIFKANSALYGPFIKNTKVPLGTYKMKFFFMSAKDVAAHGFVGGKKYDYLTLNIKVVPYTQKIVTTIKNKTLSYKTLKCKSLTTKPIGEVTGAKKIITYRKTYGNSHFTVNSKTGIVTAKKGTPKGTYTIKVKISAAGSTYYKSASKTVSFKITVK